MKKGKKGNHKSNSEVIFLKLYNCFTSATLYYSKHTFKRSIKNVNLSTQIKICTKLCLWSNTELTLYNCFTSATLYYKVNTRLKHL